MSEFFKVGDLVTLHQYRKTQIYLILKEKDADHRYKYCLVSDPFKKADEFTFDVGWSTFLSGWLKING